MPTKPCMISNAGRTEEGTARELQHFVHELEVALEACKGRNYRHMGVRSNPPPSRNPTDDAQMAKGVNGILLGSQPETSSAKRSPPQRPGKTTNPSGLRSFMFRHAEGCATPQPLCRTSEPEHRRQQFVHPTNDIKRKSNIHLRRLATSLQLVAGKAVRWLSTACFVLTSPFFPSFHRAMMNA